MTNLYITGDAIGTPTGGGKVTRCEAEAMSAVAETEAWSFPNAPRPWGPDEAACEELYRRPDLVPTLAHFYSGTFTKTIGMLRERGCKHISYTCAAHSIGVSRREHEKFGMRYDYPHLTDPDQWLDYVRGYQLANTVICPSEYSAEIMRGYGCDNVRVIPHGFEPPHRPMAPIPSRFIVGYLGQAGPDKGLSYLLQAWQIWNRANPSAGRDALLVVAGRNTSGLLPWIRECCTFGSYEVRGEVADISDVYDGICVYIQPSASEGFGCEVLEARAHGRPVICSDGAGARDHANVVIQSCSMGAIVDAIEVAYQQWRTRPQGLIELADPAGIANLTWAHIRARYEAMFRENLAA